MRQTTKSPTPMATVYQKPNSPYWYAQFYHPATGRRVAKSTGSKKRREAEKIAEDMESDERKKLADADLSKPLAKILETAAREAQAGALTPAKAEELLLRIRMKSDPDFSVVSFSEHLDSWIKDQLPHVGKSAAACYRLAESRMNKALGKRVASSPIADVKESHLKQAFEKIRESGLKAATVNMDIRIIRRALHKAVSEGLVSANAAAGIRVYPEDDSTERAPFTADEVRQMIDHPKTPEEWKGAILIAAHTGLRLGDVVSLSREHIDGAKIVIRPEKTKRKKKTVTIPLSPPCLAWIGDKKGSFFPTLSKRVPGTLSTVFTRIMASAGVARDVTIPGGIQARRSFHCLRHSFTSWLAEADVHADVRQKLTGHSSGGIHQRYTHHDDALTRAVEKLPALTPSV